MARTSRALAAAVLAAAASAATVHSGVPRCAWRLVTTPEKLNVAYPDASAVYWTQPYNVTDGLSEIILSGEFSPARFISVTPYTNAGNTIVTDASGASGLGLPDYAIAPNAGSVNPWAASSSASTPTGGRFTVTLTGTAGADYVQSGNALPLLPAGQAAVGRRPASLGFVVIRAYLPEGGELSSIVLPNVTYVFTTAAGRAVSVTRTPCSAGALKAMSEAALEAEVQQLKLKVRLSSSGSGSVAGRSLRTQAEPADEVYLEEQAGEEEAQGGAVERRLALRAAGSSGSSSNSTSSTGAAYNVFVGTPAGATGGTFPNPFNKYLALRLHAPASLDFGERTVVAIKLRAPSSPRTVNGGDGPVPWNATAPAYQLRYWSLCNYVHASPYPVVTHGHGANGTEYGCLADSDVSLNSRGVAFVVLALPRHAPRNAVNFIPMPTQPRHRRAEQAVLLRNMMPAPSFSHAVNNVPTGANATQAAAIMGSYYPEVVLCRTAHYEAGGYRGCKAFFQRHGGSV